MKMISPDDQDVVWRNSGRWQAYLSGRYPGVEVVVRPDQKSFRARYRAWNFGGIEFAEIRSTSPQRLFISVPGTASPDSYYLPLQVQGSFHGGQFNRECSNSRRTMMLLDSRAPHWREMSAESHLLNVRLPAAMLERYLIDPRKFCVNALRADSGRAALVWDFLISLWSRRAELGTSDVALADTAAQLVAELFASVTVEANGRTDALRREVLHCISTHLADTDMNVDSVAIACDISSRYLHLLMKHTGRTFSQYVLEQRLEQCRKALLNYDASTCSITHIAFSWGFNDMSHFSRVFRHRFGVPPREYRRSHSR